MSFQINLIDISKVMDWSSNLITHVEIIDIYEILIKSGSKPIKMVSTKLICWKKTFWTLTLITWGGTV